MFGEAATALTRWEADAARLKAKVIDPPTAAAAARTLVKNVIVYLRWNRAWLA